MSNDETNVRAANREWIATANEAQLRDLAFWLNAYNPHAVQAALADDTDES
jgi:hypothetical protein